MKKSNFTIYFFIYALLSYFFYFVYYVLIKKAGYHNGIFYFSPSFIFSIFVLMRSGLKKTANVTLFTAIPYAVSLYLSLAGHPLQGWETTGFIPVVILAAYCFKNQEGATPLDNEALPKIVNIFLAVITAFTAIHFIKSNSLNDSLYFAATIFSLTPVAVPAMLFISFIVSTTAVSAIIKNMKFFNINAPVSRLIFDTDSFLNIPLINLSGIETVKNLKREDFLRDVERLNEAAQNDPAYTEKIKKDKFYTHRFEDGTAITQAPLTYFLQNKSYSHEGLKIPAKNDGRKFIAFAKENQVVGYYAIDQMSATTNVAFLELFRKQYKIDSLIVNPQKPQRWKDFEMPKTLEEAAPRRGDLIITEKAQTNSEAISVLWGEANSEESGDIYLTKPFLTTVLNLIIVTRGVHNKLIRGVIICSLPYLIQLFTFSFGIVLPQISSISMLLSFAMTIFYVFYFKPVSKRAGF